MSFLGHTQQAFWTLTVLSGLMLAGLSPAGAATDVAAPAIVSNAVSATALDVTQAPAKLSFSVRLSDETAVSSHHARLIHPGTGQSYFFPNATLNSGTTQNGVWRSTMTVPQGVASGQWVIQIFSLEDALKNSTMGFIEVRTITVVSGATDTAAPAIVSHAVSSATLDVTQAPVKLSFSVRLSDDTAVSGFHARFLHQPSGQYYYFPNHVLNSGTTQNGVWRSTITVPQGVASGQWTIQIFSLEDILKNSTMGFIEVRTITVVSGSSTDVTAPVIVSHAVSSTTLDVTQAPAKLTFSVRISDETAVSSFHTRFIHPETGQSYFFPNATLASGTVQNGVWRSAITLPQGVASGDWIIQVFSLEDVVKNATTGFINVRTISVKSGA